MVFTTSKVASMAIAIGSASAHLMMTNPLPYAPDTLLYDPIAPASNQFPCASGKGNYVVAQQNEATAGTTIPVTFDGSAVHGGGVCQFSVTYENPPPEDPAQWKVIHTIIGGCPAAAAGNLAETGQSNEFGKPTGNQCGNSDGTECLRTFDVPIPAELPTGSATFAWTWFNEIGNREMYMNCAPMTINGGSDSTDFFNALPQIWVANAGVVNGQQSCVVPDGSFIYDIPAENRGNSVVELEAPNSPAFSGAECGPQGTPGSAPPATISQPEPVNAAPEEPAVEPATPEPVQQAPAAPAAPAGGNSGSCGADGSMVCFGATQFGICVGGSAVPQAVAAGTTCSNGQIVKKRSIGARSHARSL